MNDKPDQKNCLHRISRVTDSRSPTGFNAPIQGAMVRRRRECQLCAVRFTTYEVMEHEIAKFKDEIMGKTLERINSQFAPRKEIASS